MYAGCIAQIASCPNDALRQQWSQHALDKAYNHVPLADPIRGIFGAMPVETMHAFCKGVIEVVTFQVLDNVPKRHNAALARPVGSPVSQITSSVISQSLPCYGFLQWNNQFDKDFGCETSWSGFLVCYIVSIQ